MDEETKAFLLGFENRINKRIDELEERLDKRIDEKSEKALAQQSQDIAQELHSILRYIDEKLGSRYTKIQKNIKEVDYKLEKQNKRLSRGFKQMANDIESKVPYRK